MFNLKEAAHVIKIQKERKEQRKIYHVENTGVALCQNAVKTVLLYPLDTLKNKMVAMGISSPVIM